VVVSEELLIFGKLFTETNEQKFSFGGVKCKKICSHPGRNLIYSIVKVIYVGVVLGLSGCLICMKF